MNIHVDLDNKDYEVSTFGGYYVHEDVVIDDFGIQIEDFSLTITSKTAVNLIKELTKHLESNNIKI